ncbi:MAG: hypothetical protein PUD60_03380, partial [Akkermansia muciniphila]|nr:hypothetical protein [Akkermansia muciniphila]
SSLSLSSPASRPVGCNRWPVSRRTVTPEKSLTLKIASPGRRSRFRFLFAQALSGFPVSGCAEFTPFSFERQAYFCKNRQKSAKSCKKVPKTDHFRQNRHKNTLQDARTAAKRVQNCLKRSKKPRKRLRARERAYAI